MYPLLLLSRRLHLISSIFTCYCFQKFPQGFLMTFSKVMSVIHPHPSFSKLSIPTPFSPSYFIYSLPCVLLSIPLFLDSSSPRTLYPFPEFCGSNTLKTFAMLIRHFITFLRILFSSLAQFWVGAFILLVSFLKFTEYVND